MQRMGLMLICCGMAVKGTECEEDEGTDTKDGDSDTRGKR
jgi:hypothetical protein